VRDDDQRAPFPETTGAADALDDLVCRGGVEVRAGFVQQQDGRIAQQRAGDGDALTLAGGKLQTPFPDGGIEPLR
jgi:hypothetical protein